MEGIFDFILNILSVFAGFGDWLVTPLDYINLSPLGLISVGGITFLIGIHIVKLFI